MYKTSKLWIGAVIVALAGCAGKDVRQAPTAYDFVTADIQRRSEQENVEAKPATQQKRASARVDVAMAQYQAGGFERAYAASKEAIDLDSKNLNAWIILSLSEERLKVPTDQVIKTYESALQTFGSQHDIMHNFGWYLCRNGMNKKGEEYLISASKSSQNSVPERSYMALSKCLVGINVLAAEEYAKKALDAQPKWADAWLSLAIAQLAKRDLERAHKAMTQYFENEDKPTVEAMQTALKIATARKDTFHINVYTQKLNNVAPHRSE